MKTMTEFLVRKKMNKQIRKNKVKELVKKISKGAKNK